MKKQEPVSAIMTKKVVAVQVEEKLAAVRDLMSRHKIRHIPVLYGKQLVGIVSRTDINRLTFGSLFEGQQDADDAMLEMLSLRQVMSHKPRVVHKSDAIRAVAEVFLKEEFHALPVVDDKDESKLVGIVTTTDVIRYMLSGGGGR
jgi:CBS domain-containing protein